MTRHDVTDGPTAVVEGAIHLVGGKCAECAAVIFPRPSGCSRCGSTVIADHLLPRTGALWSWTVQSFVPKSPPFEGSTDGFEPFGLGYVDVGDVIVEARLTVADAERLSIGMAMELTSDEFAPGRRTFAFAPIEDGRP